MNSHRGLFAKLKKLNFCINAVNFFLGIFIPVFTEDYRIYDPLMSVSRTRHFSWQ